MTEGKRKTVVVPKVSAKISPLESSFELTLPENNSWFGEDTFRFSISADGTVELNDNTFNSKEQAVKAFEAIAAYLKK